jgi:muramoyltetrapeptide carboxypeptidase
VALVAPAGPLAGPEDVERGAANVRAFGWEPVVGRYVLGRHGYFAGSDEERLADLQWALRDAAIDAVWCLRGGYGTMRLLDALDYDALARHPKAILGYSDVTALHAAVGRHAGLATFHGPVARARLPEMAARSLRAALTQDGDPCGVAAGARCLRGGTASGPLAGGNLALLAALAGTPYAPDLEGAILVLEDVNEAVYRIDRMLRQLRLAGMLDGVRGLAFGHFTAIPADGDEGERLLDDVLAELADELRVPCLAGIPMGHLDEQWTLPLGTTAALDADAGRLDVELATHGPAAIPAAAASPHPELPMTHKSGADLIAEAKQRITELSPDEARERQERDASLVFLDVREPNEWNLGHVPGAVHIPRGMMETKIEQAVPRDREVVIYCASGNRSALAADTLRQMGYEKVSSMAGGWRDWVQSGGAVEG